MADTFRKQYQPVSPERSAHITAVKEKAEELETLLDAVEPGRELSLAKTNLEQAIMWAVKGMTR